MENLERGLEKLQHDGTAHTFSGLFCILILIKKNIILYTLHSVTQQKNNTLAQFIKNLIFYSFFFYSFSKK